MESSRELLLRLLRSGNLSFFVWGFMGEVVVPGDAVSLRGSVSWTGNTRKRLEMYNLKTRSTSRPSDPWSLQKDMQEFRTFRI